MAAPLDLTLARRWGLPAGATAWRITTDLQADIVAFSQNRGLFAGLSLQGSVLNQRSDWNRSYYGREMSPQQIV
ncbi:MAG TPA: YSC84-related protein, partial [Thermoanaerobaculia bacterium]|nr:YSC84-related protein [Thermoanaerobaculia bacterium]